MRIRYKVPCVGLMVISIATASFGRVAPDPLPAYASLAGVPNRVLYTVDDLVGNRWHVGLSTESTPVEVYVWDLALALGPDGSVYFLRWELQSADDYAEESRDIETLPTGTVEIYDLRDAFTSKNVLYTDPDGIIAMIPASSVAPGTIGDGGTIKVPPGLGGGANCTATGIVGWCTNAFSCDSSCGTDLQCRCGDLFWGACIFVAVAPTCHGACASGHNCAPDNAMGCGCQ